MAEFLTIDVRGEKEIEAFFRRVPEAVGQRVLMTAMKAGALVVRNRVVPIAPFLAGVYRDSIGIDPRPAQLAVAIGTDLPYGPRLEYGFVGTDSLGRHYNQAARPHFRPGFGQSKDEIVTIVRDAIRAQIRRLT